jgi:signal transduction histidine kinase
MVGPVYYFRGIPMSREGERMKAIEIAKIFYKLQKSVEGDPDPRELVKSEMRGGLTTVGGPKEGFSKTEGIAGRSPEEGEKTASEELERTQRENQFLVEQLVKASAVIRELQDKNFETSHKQRVGKVIVSGLLHDLRNPLAVIRSCAQFCLDNADLSPSFREKVQMILESTEKANELTKKFLHYAKSSVLDFKPLNFNRLLLVTWKTCELQSAPCQVGLEARLEKKLPEIMASKENLERVFLNLFMNAIHAVSRKGKVVLETRLLPSRDMVEIKITDDGPGISREQQERLFEPFYTTKENGTGLGLSICQSIIQQHKGSISFESTPGQGTTVSVRLPVLQNDSSEHLEDPPFNP